MNWRSNRLNESCLFRELAVGQTFEHEDIFYIKITNADAFDIINNKFIKDCWNNTTVQPVEHEIIITD
mgnify:CR=1 FL=1